MNVKLGTITAVGCAAGIVNIGRGQVEADEAFFVDCLHGVQNHDGLTPALRSDLLFQSMEEEIALQIAAAHKRNALLEESRAMQNSSSAEESKAAYNRFVALAADHMTVLGPFLPALSSLFG